MPAKLAILPAIFGDQRFFCDQPIAEIKVTFDGSVFARTADEPVAKHFISSYADLLRNWLGLIAAAGLSQHEFIEAESLFAAKIGFFGPPSA